MPSLKMSGAIHLLPLYALTACTGALSFLHIEFYNVILSSVLAPGICLLFLGLYCPQFGHTWCQSSGETWG